MKSPITVNGLPRHDPGEATVGQLVAEWCRSPKGVAVALNGEIVPRSRWDEERVRPGDAVEIVTAAAGG